jgi:hypothetical protein
MEVTLEPKENPSEITIVQFTTSDSDDLEYRQDALIAIHESSKYDSTVYVRIHTDEENPGMENLYNYVGEITSTPIFISIVNNELFHRFDGVPTFDELVALAG